MNILFYTTSEVSPEKGGTERITASIADTLSRNFGCKCYSMYSVPLAPVFRRASFESSYCLGSLKSKAKRKDIHRFITEKHIDVIVIQGCFWLCGQLKEIIYDLPNVRLVLCHHFQPGWEVHFLQFRTFVHKPRDIFDFIQGLCSLAKYPLYKLINVWSVKRAYRNGYNYADKTILLSSNFIPEFMTYSGIRESSKFGVIHNMLSFNIFFNIEEYERKKYKEVLIVSRLDDPQKRLSLAIRIWAIIEADNRFNGWKLRIVGHGIDEPMYRNLARKLRLKHLSFEGVQQSQPYYERASLFMMTSKSEGWGLTLTEAQQMGCVPLAFDTYASLHDIINDGDNGFIIKECNLDEYADKMKLLMLDDIKRKNMARNAIDSSHRFDQRTIGEQWYDLLEGLVEPSDLTNIKGG